MFKDKDGNSFDHMGDLNTLIGKGTTFEGNLSVQHSLRIDGKFVGNIKSTDSIIVGKEGIIEGEIDAALFYGLLVWEAVQRHTIEWCFIKQQISDDQPTGMTYFRRSSD